MARPRAANNASKTTALLLFLMAVPGMETAVAQHNSSKNRLKAGIKSMLAPFGVDEHAEGALTGLIEFLVGFVLMLVVLLVAYIILPIFNAQSKELENDENTTPEQKSLLPVPGLLLIVAILVVPLGVMVDGFRRIVGSFK